MPKPTLHQTLNAVRGALESPDELDREDLDLLMSIHRDIERVLEATSEVAGPRSSSLRKACAARFSGSSLPILRSPPRFRPSSRP